MIYKGILRFFEVLGLKQEGNLFRPKGGNFFAVFLGYFE